MNGLSATRPFADTYILQTLVAFDATEQRSASNSRLWRDTPECFKKENMIFRLNQGGLQ
jgi:hypothetical protein